jgi:aryl-alcohol dehydrogenase-like predicted oxidoreductase
MKAMQKHSIGISDLQVAPLVFGGNVSGWTTDERASFSIPTRSSTPA